MIQSKSFTNIRQPRQFSRSYLRCAYYNQQVNNRKDNTTVFHSPFKNGKKNKQYTNPSFISSDLFYPQQVADQNLKLNIVKNRNQKVQQQLYNDRIKKLDCQLKKVFQVNLHSKKQTSRYKKSENSVGKSRKIIPKEQLIKQLNTLVNYQQNKESDEKHYLNKYKNQQSSTSVFLDNLKHERQKKDDIKRRNQLKEWAVISKRVKNMKKDLNIENKNRQKQYININVRRNNEKMIQKQKQSRRNAGLLAQILKEQIKQQRKNKQI